MAIAIAPVENFVHKVGLYALAKSIPILFTAYPLARAPVFPNLSPSYPHVGIVRGRESGKPCLQADFGEVGARCSSTEWWISYPHIQAWKAAPDGCERRALTHNHAVGGGLNPLPTATWRKGGGSRVPKGELTTGDADQRTLSPGDRSAEPRRGLGMGISPVENFGTYPQVIHAAGKIFPRVFHHLSPWFSTGHAL